MTATRTNYVELLEGIMAVWCWAQPENEADCVALRQLAELLRQVTPEAVGEMRQVVSEAGSAHSRKSPRSECVTCMTADSLLAVLASLAAPPEEK